MSKDPIHPRDQQCDQAGIYEIRVQGELDESWADWFRGLSIVLERASDGPTVTVLIGPVSDQAALRGILSRVWDLNLTLISLRRVEADDKRKQDND